MRQSLFVKQNETKWKRYEEQLRHMSSMDIDRLTTTYVDLTEDYAFARAKYPGSQLTAYLREQSIKVHQHIHKNKPERSRRFITFWTEEIPQTLRSTRKEQLYAFLTLLVGALMGFLSGANDADFARLILGDQYVDMTLSNIASGDPMAVYKGHSESSMFFMITINNIRVSFLAFAFGIIFSVGTGYILFSNGVMLGVFHQLFFSQNVWDETILTIWIHGTLEISAIVIAGAAGITMGNSFLFPGSYPRLHSLRAGAKKGLKIVVSLIPFFIVAGFLESVLTRNTHWPLWSKLFIIMLSFAIVIFYLFVFPSLKNHESKN